MNIRCNSRIINTDKEIGEKTTIVTLSDVHFKNDKYIARLNDLKEILKEIKPNVICIPGDFLDEFDDIRSSSGRQNSLDILEQISKISLTLMSFGAHDFFSDNKEKQLDINKWFDELKILSDTFIPFIPNEKRIIQIDDKLFAGGYSLPIEENYRLENKEELINEISSFVNSLDFDISNYNILLCHSPAPFFRGFNLKTQEELNMNKINLILSGHNHAGLAPKILESLNLGIISPDKKILPKSPAGLFSNDDLAISISRGFLKIPGTVKAELGTIGQVLYETNSLLKPDIDVLTIAGKSKTKQYHF